MARWTTKLDVPFALFLALHAMRPRLTQYTHHGFSKTIASLFHAHTSARPSFSHLCKANDALDYGRVSYAQHALLRRVPFAYLTGASSELRLHMETPSTFWSQMAQTTGLLVLFSYIEWNANATVVVRRLASPPSQEAPPSTAAPIACLDVGAPRACPTRVQHAVRPRILCCDVPAAFQSHSGESGILRGTAFASRHETRRRQEGEASKETGVKARKEAGAGSMRSGKRKKSAERIEGGSARASKQDERVEQVRGAGRGGALCLAH
ncbi:hypothetical protein B0H11DRAFT_1930714 [Mycena galericulata]|nr:hypothetical protein B0H11DRAFT_1930714 [Mycena galericulata]